MIKCLEITRNQQKIADIQKHLYKLQLEQKDMKGLCWC